MQQERKAGPTQKDKALASFVLPALSCFNCMFLLPLYNREPRYKTYIQQFIYFSTQLLYMLKYYLKERMS